MRLIKDHEISLIKDTAHEHSKIKEDYLQKISDEHRKKSGIKRDHQIAIKKLDQLRNHLKIAKAKEKSAE